MSSASYVHWQHGTARINWLLLMSTGRAAIDWYLLLLGAQQQTCSSGVCRLSDRTDRQMDVQQLHRPCSAYYANKTDISYLILPYLTDLHPVTADDGADQFVRHFKLLGDLTTQKPRPTRIAASHYCCNHTHTHRFNYPREPVPER